jgi:iron complex outermembrane receptor protein
MQLGLLWLSNNVQSTGAGFYLNSHARFLINGLVDFSIRRLGFSTGFVYKKRNQQTANALNTTLSADYFLLNTRIQFSFGKKEQALYLQADNLLNRKYSDLLGAPMPGRWLSIGARFGR